MHPGTHKSGEYSGNIIPWRQPSMPLLQDGHAAEGLYISHGHKLNKPANVIKCKYNSKAAFVGSGRRRNVECAKHFSHTDISVYGTIPPERTGDHISSAFPTAASH